MVFRGFRGMWRRRSFLLSAIGTAGLAPALSWGAVDPMRGSLRVSIALADQTSLYHLPLTLAEQLGYFRQAGLSVDLLGHDSGAKALASALQGQADVVAGAFEHLFGLHNKGLNYQAFVQMGRTPQVSLGLASRLGSRSFAALKGARVGITALNSNTHWMACQWLLQNGLAPDDVVFVVIGASGAMVEALRTGKIDALCSPDPVMHWLEQKNEIKLLGEARTLSATRQLMGGAVPGACLFGRVDFLQRHPQVIQALTDAVVHALKWLQTAGLTDILKTVPANHWLGDRAIYLGAFEKLRESYGLDGVISPIAVQNAWRAHARLPGALKIDRLAWERTYTNAFSGRSKTRFDA